MVAFSSYLWSTFMLLVISIATHSNINMLKLKIDPNVMVFICLLVETLLVLGVIWVGQ